MKVALFSHGHPQLRIGGAEVAAYSLFSKLKECAEVQPVFVARAEREEIDRNVPFGIFRNRSDEMLLATPPFDFFRLVSKDSGQLTKSLSDLCSHLTPDLVHFAHYTLIGLDAIEIVKEHLGIPTVLTLHEFLPICSNFGWMRKNNGRLCYREGPRECNQCFPFISSGRFFLRKQSIRSKLELVDTIISPSRFLKQRFVEWGIDAEKIVVIENLYPRVFESDVYSTRAAPRELRPESPAKRYFHFGFFGQLMECKGLELVLDALDFLEANIRERLALSLWGSNLENQSEEFKKRFEEKLAANADVVSFHGGYRNDDVLNLMQTVDWVLVPSLWWENSPVVIEEAKAAGRPVLCSNIGGMAEKVVPGRDGEHFLTGSAMHLASKMTEIVNGRHLVHCPPRNISDLNISRFQAHLDQYRKVLGVGTQINEAERVNA